MSTDVLHCEAHPRTPAEAACVVCERLLCGECRHLDAEGLSVCPVHAELRDAQPIAQVLPTLLARHEAAQPIPGPAREAPASPPAEARSPEASAPEAPAPEAPAPEASAPEAPAPEASAPEAPAPEAPASPPSVTRAEPPAVDLRKAAAAQGRNAEPEPPEVPEAPRPSPARPALEPDDRWPFAAVPDPRKAAAGGQARAARDRAAQDRAAQDRATQDRAAQERAARNRAAQERAAQERADQQRGAETRGGAERGPERSGWTNPRAPGRPDAAGAAALDDAEVADRFCPWEASDAPSDLAAFARTAGLALGAPVRFPALQVWVRGDKVAPLIFALLCVGVGGALSALAGLLGFGVGATVGVPVGMPAALSALPELPLAVYELLFMPVLPLATVLSIGLHAGLAHLLLRAIGAAHAPFEATWRIICYAQVAHLLSWLPEVGPLAENFYLVFLVLGGVRGAHGGGVLPGLVALLPLLLARLPFAGM